MNETFSRRYRLLERIAIGGTAEVFRALFLTGDGGERPVVIKRVLPQFARDERFRRLFHEEACVAVTMSHPSIVRVLDHGDIGQTCYIALELVDGKDLGSMLGAAQATGRLPSPPLAAYITAQVAAALQFIHDQTSSEGTPLQIIHRDVSPQNILVSYAGDVKLTDFGIAKSAIRRERTVDGVLRGKLDYMAPEQAELGDVDRRADIFALGCVLYEMVQGEPPFRGASEIETLERVRHGRVRIPPSELDSPEPLRRILARALEPRREVRYQTAAEMEADLRAFLASQAAPVAAADLGGWVTELSKQPAEVSANRVDEAVRQLLGDTSDEATSAPQPGATTVFASTGRREAATIAPPAPPPRAARSLNIALVVIAALGLCGWGLWGLWLLRAPSGRADSGASTDQPRRVAHIAIRDASSRAKDAGPRETVLRSAPPAKVYVDGEPAGSTPLLLQLPRHSFLLELRKEGYQVWRKRLSPEEAPAALEVVLSPAVTGGTAQLTINSMPWSKVRIDGKTVGNTPLLKYPARAGRCRIELVGADGKVRKSFQVTLRKGERRSFTFDLTR